MAKVVVFLSPSGLNNVAVCVPTGELPIDQVHARQLDKHPDAKIIDDSELPQEANDFFDGWRFDADGKVVVDLDAAKEITKNRLRVERAPLLEAQDVAFQRALETGGDTSAIVAEKARLRDVTKLVDGCATLEELRALKAA